MTDQPDLPPVLTDEDDVPLTDEVPDDEEATPAPEEKP